jgi:hypothetical protein
MQTQCPNCGGYKVSEEIERKVLKKEIEMKYGSVTCLMNLTIAAVIAFFAIQVDRLLGVFLGLLLFILFTFFQHRMRVRLGGGKLIRFVKVTRVPLEPVTHYTCMLCGFRWDSNQDLPVSFRPDLIAKGEQRLQEVEEVRKRQEQMQAAWWLDQQRHKGGK